MRHLRNWWSPLFKRLTRLSVRRAVTIASEWQSSSFQHRGGTQTDGRAILLRLIRIKTPQSSKERGWQRHCPEKTTQAPGPLWGFFFPQLCLVPQRLLFSFNWQNNLWRAISKAFFRPREWVLPRSSSPRESVQTTVVSRGLRELSSLATLWSRTPPSFNEC